MSTPHVVNWDKAIREKAKAEGRASFGLGVEGKFGRWEIARPIDDDGTAEALAFFVIKLSKGATPAEAFAQVKWPEPKAGGAA